MAKHVSSHLFLRTACSPSCVSVRKRVCFSSPWWWGLLDAQFVRAPPFTVVFWEAMGWLQNFVLFKTFMDVSQSRLRQGVFAEGLPRSRRAVAVLDWVGRKERFQVLFSVLDFFIQPNLVLQQLHSRCYDNVSWVPREKAKLKKHIENKHFVN